MCIRDRLSSGRFFNVLDETDDLSNIEIKRIILCLGKVYYDLRAARRERKISSIAIIRIEQIYPFPHEDLLAILSKYPNIEDIVWCQEEPMNQGAWYRSQHYMRRAILRHKIDIDIRFVGRESSASTAAGYMALHLEQQETFINEALGPLPGD